LPLVLFVYYTVDKAYRNGVLLFFSLLFYGWGETEMLTIMLVSTMINYFIGIGIEKAQSSFYKKIILGCGITITLSLLLYFKYANFIVDNYNFAAHILDVNPLFWNKIILPLGISFYTFHGISYMIDVYRKHTESQKNPLTLALYISFFPQLIAGPIVRYKDIENQLLNREVDLNLFVSGIKRFIIGLSKKLLVANIVGRVPDMVFNMPETEWNAYWSWLSIIAATIQVYLDFSGYSDMAIGLARMFGFKFQENFIYPFIAQSMKEFWTRWHISLSTWFRDYVYIPLGGSKNGTFRTYLNLSIIFLVTGFWHGASWSYILFGGFHGLLIIAERLGLEKLLNVFHRSVRSLYVFFVTAFSIIFFSIDNLHQIKVFYKSLFHFSAPDAFNKLNLYLTTEWYITLVIGILISIPTVEFLLDKIKNEKRKQLIEMFCIITLFVLSLSELANTSYNPFIYFRF
jgi:alginate O-acetyltransferase complex protein AlgI